MKIFFEIMDKFGAGGLKTVIEKSTYFPERHRSFSKNRCFRFVRKLLFVLIK